MDTQRNIVPLLVNGFTFNGLEPYLTGKLDELPRFNGLNVHHDFFEEAMERLRKRYLKQPVYGTITPAPASDQQVVEQKIAQAAALEVSDILPPPFEWVRIPGGIVTLEDASIYQGTIGGAYRIASFEIAKYPITNAQYQVFADALDGYTNPQWWRYSDHAQQWHTANPQPQERAFPQDDHPRTNVSWYESVAFCCWLTAKITPRQITLPTEQQWQRAAVGDTGWAYPWGNEWDPNRCNSSVDAKSRTTMSVREHPQGASPYGVIDISGNAWEWCLTWWETDSIRLSGSHSRVMRGGSWGFDDPDFFRATYRYWDGPESGNSQVGFRCVRL
jgi:formylglycine-generating enzyme required for sulfatase activity